MQLDSVDNQFLDSEPPLPWPRILKDWRYIVHPLRQNNFDAVIQEYSNRMSDKMSLPHFFEGKPRTIWTRTDDGIWLCGIRKLSWDSDFFGFGIARIEPLIYPPNVEVTPDSLSFATRLVANAVAFAKQENISQLVSSVDPADSLMIYALEECGFRLKDTMNFHFFDLTTFTPKPRNEKVRLGRIEDAGALGEVAFRCFSGQKFITNRFNTDPQYPAHLVGDMYKTWIERSLRGEMADAVFVAEHEGRPVGFLTAILPKDEQITLGIPFGDQGVGAVDPTAQRLGIFSGLHNEVLAWFKARNIRYALTRTALSTSGVNKVCVRHGSTIPCSHHTFHADLRS